MLSLLFSTLAVAGPSCGAGQLLPNWSAPCTNKECTLLKEVLHTTNSSLCCTICSAVASCDAWTLNNEICHCKAQDIRNPSQGKAKRGPVSGFFVAAPTPAPAPPAPAPKGAKNLLYVVVDDLRNELSFTNNRKGLVTPNLDALAAKGMVFSRAYVQQQVCSPSRNSFLSGRRPDTTQLWNFKGSFRDRLGDNVSTWPGAFKNAGWITSGMGKVFHPNSPPHDDGALSWDLDFAPYMHPQNFTSKIETGAPDSDYQDGQITATALDRIDQWSDAKAAATKAGKPYRPFFIAVGLHKPHTPWIMPQRFLDEQIAVAAIDVATRDVPPVNYCNVSLYICNNEYSGLPWEPASKAEQQDKRQKYRAAVTWTDYNVGKILAKLDARGLSASTAVVFHGDHGWHLGEQGGWCKQSNFDIVARVPLIVYVPWLPASHGARSAALVEIVDLFPTTLELFGIGDAAHVHDFAQLEGTSFAPLLRAPGTAVSAWKNATISQYPRCAGSTGAEPWEYPSDNACTAVAKTGFSVMGYTLRSDRWRYTIWLKWDGAALAVAGWEGDSVVGEELYDHDGDDGLDTDAFDNENVAAANSDVCARLKGALRAGWKAARPPAVLARSEA